MLINETDRSFRRCMVETILAFGLFVIISVIIVRLFFYADNFSKEAVNNSQAVLQAESIAELLKGSSSFEAAVKELGMTLQDETNEGYYLMRYDTDESRTSDSNHFIIRVEITSDVRQFGTMEIASITVYKALKDSEMAYDTNNELCCLEVKKYRY